MESTTKGLQGVGTMNEFTKGEKVEVTEQFYFYDEFFPVGTQFEIEEQHVKHNFEKFCKRAEG